MSIRTEELFKAGAHFGYSKTRRHPTVKKYVFTTKNKVDIVDIEQTLLNLESAEAFMKELSSKGKKVLFVGTKPEAKDIVKAAAQSIDMPFITERWAGGVLTNHTEIKKRVEKLEALKTQKENGELEARYTKKERLLIDEDIARMHRLFSGLSGMTKLPDAVFIVDPRREYIARTEAIALGIPVIALASTDTDLRGIAYPIVANDSAVSSINYVVSALTTAWKSGVQGA